MGCPATTRTTVKESGCNAEVPGVRAQFQVKVAVYSLGGSCALAVSVAELLCVAAVEVSTASARVCEYVTTCPGSGKAANHQAGTSAGSFSASRFPAVLA